MRWPHGREVLPIRGVLLGVGLVLGAVAVIAEVMFLLAGGLVLLACAPWRRGRPVRDGVLGLARVGADWHRRRVRLFFGAEDSSDVAGERALGYLSLRWLLGLLGGFVLLTLGLGAVFATTLLWAWSFDGGRWSLFGDTAQVSTTVVVAYIVPGVVLLYLNLAGIAGVAGLERRLAGHFFGPSTHEVMRRRISRLAETRAAVLDAVNDERRRIERDLHDGVQQRLVALGMLVGRARRAQSRTAVHDGAGGEDPVAAELDRLLAAAHEEAQRALEDLREVGWRVYPSALAGGGLPAALEIVAERSPLRVDLRVDVAERLPEPVETVAYFVVCEAVTNATKHAGADLVQVHVRGRENMLLVSIRDEGRGGADPAGGGLSGLARRVAALDGDFTVTSPPGGPTVIEVELPCA